MIVVRMFKMSKFLKSSLSLTAPMPWFIPNEVTRNGSVGSSPRLGTPETILELSHLNGTMTKIIKYYFTPFQVVPFDS